MKPGIFVLALTIIAFLAGVISTMGSVETLIISCILMGIVGVLASVANEVY